MLLKAKGPFGSLVDLEHATPGMVALPSHKFRVGDIVGLDEHVSGRQEKGKKTDAAKVTGKVSGVVYRVTDQTITLALKYDLPDELQDRCRLSKLANNITYERMKDAMTALKSRHFEPTSGLVRVLFGLQKPVFDKEVQGKLEFYDETLNEAQRAAVGLALGAQEIALVHGPPGTGKTYTCVEIIRQLVKRGERVLVCGPSNISVDNLVERLAKCRLDIVRVGHPARVLGSVLDHALEVRVRTSDEGQIVNDVRREMDKTLQDAQKAKSGTLKLKTRERTVVDTIIRNAKVVLSTLNGAASKTLMHEEFDTVLIDEATQALEAESWIAILKGKRLILAGDHLQLPPTVKSKDATRKKANVKGKAGKGGSAKTKAEPTEKGSTPSTKSATTAPASSKDVFVPSLEFTLFDRLLKVYGDGVKKLLNVQYRMNEMIMRFPSDELYNGKLIAHDSVQDRLLTDLKGVASDGKHRISLAVRRVIPGSKNPIMNKTTENTTIPLLMIDTSGCDMRETAESDDAVGDLGGESRYNQGEADLVCEHIDKLVGAGVSDADIAVISPYNAQVNLLRLALKEKYPNLEIGSVDGFQGREKEAIVLTLVRSNDDGEVGFLSEKRRLNVALTRARRHLCLITDGATVREGGGFLERMCEFFEENGEVRVP
ncbi:hypothetical protein HK104_000009 [Borealophlyctis nickersoniae]|nr:hypothetical protein HK104_000009 [Borealophlyctis nickersoniae]